MPINEHGSEYAGAWKCTPYCNSLWMLWVHNGKPWNFWGWQFCLLMWSSKCKCASSETSMIFKTPSCPSAVLCTPSQKPNISLFHLPTVADLAPFCTETSHHNRFSMPCWLRPMSAVLNIVHDFLFPCYYLPCFAKHSSTWTNVLCLCPFACLYAHFLFNNSANRSIGGATWMTQEPPDEKKVLMKSFLICCIRCHRVTQFNIDISNKQTSQVCRMI